MLNKCMFIGNLGKDPEVRSMQNGDKVANLSLGVSEKWKDKATGEKKERTEWVRVTIFGQLAEVAERFLKKGSKVYVCGQMQTRKWTDKDGADKYSTEIVLQGFRAELLMLDGKQSAGDDTPVADRARATSRDDMDSDIPF
jgi:single-strand DNA-binding protein